MLKSYEKKLKDDTINKIKKLSLFILAIPSFLSLYSPELKNTYHFDIASIKPILLALVVVAIIYIIIETGFIAFYNKNSEDNDKIHINNTSYMLICGFMLVCLIS